MEFNTRNYVTWDEYMEDHQNLSDIESAKRIQIYEDQVFALVLRLFR